MGDPYIHFGKVGSREEWDTNVQLTFARNCETGEGVWIRPAPSRELPGDGWDKLAEVPVGSRFSALNLRQIGEFDGYPVCVLDSVLKGESRLTFTQGRAPMDILSPITDRDRVSPLVLEKTLALQPGNRPHLPWSVSFYWPPDNGPLWPDQADQPDLELYAEVTVVPGNKNPRSLLQLSTLHYDLSHDRESGCEWSEMKKGELNFRLTGYRDPENEDLVWEPLTGLTRESDYIPSDDIRTDSPPRHTIVHNAASADCFFVISLSEQGFSDDFVDEFLTTDQAPGGLEVVEDAPVARSRT